MAERTAPAVAALLFNAFVWGVSWWPFRQLQGHGLHPLAATAIIYVFSLACLLALRPASAHGLLRQPWLWLLAAASGFTNLGFNWAVTVGDVVRVVLLFYLMPAWSVLLAWGLLGERPTRVALLRLVIALAGVFVVLGGEGAGWPVPRALPDWLALLGGFSFALTNILLRKLDTVPPPERIFAMFAGGALAAGSLALSGLVAGANAIPAWAAPWALLALGLAVAFLLGNVALQYGASRLPAHVTALVMLAEVVFASLSAAALGAAEFSPRTLVGGALILTAAAWSAWPASTGARANAQ